MMQSIVELKGKHKGKTGWLVGKGPSLQFLARDNFGEGPVVAINEAILKVQQLNLHNPVYSMQKDYCSNAPYKMDGVNFVKPELQPHLVCENYKVKPINNIPVFLSETESKYCMPDYEPKYLFDCEKDFNAHWASLSAIIGIRILQLMGCDKVNFLCFDAVIKQNYTTHLRDGTIYLDSAAMGNAQTLINYIKANRVDNNFITPLLKIPGKKTRLIISTPFYEMKAFSPYVTSLLASQRLLYNDGIMFDYWDLSGDSYVDRARNTICNRFLETDATDLLFIDSDMAWHPAAINKILESPYEVTGAAYPIKNNWKKFGCDIEMTPDGKPVIDAAGYVKAVWVPAGFLLMKRSCIEKMADAYKDDYYHDMSADPADPGRKYINIFNCCVENAHRYGEDVNFCRKWKAIGGELWIEPRINFSHFGTTGWSGNYDEYLRQQYGNIAALPKSGISAGQTVADSLQQGRRIVSNGNRKAA